MGDKCRHRWIYSPHFLEGGFSIRADRICEKCGKHEQPVMTRGMLDRKPKSFKRFEAAVRKWIKGPQRRQVDG